MKGLKLTALLVGLAAGAVYLYREWQRNELERDPLAPIRARDLGPIRITPPKSITIRGVPPL